MIKRAATIVALVLAVAPALRAAQVIPVTAAQFSTGQWYFDGRKSALGGNAGLQFVPAVKFSDKLSLLPSFESNYRGTRSAQELAGGATLFQDTWENAIGAKLVSTPSHDWTFRGRVSGRMKWFRETTNETWNNGLYDYRSVGVGAEAERHWGKTSAALGYDLSYLQFPNYSSLESSQPSDLAREFAGNHVLDSMVHIVSTRLRAPMPGRVAAELDGFYSPRFYSDQHVVVITGLLTSQKRQDVTTGATLSLDRPFRGPKSTPIDSTLMLGYTGLSSNQNHYDARVTTFIPKFYDYDQYSIGESLRAGFGRSSSGLMIAELGGSYSYRAYSSRVIQDAGGLYLSEKLHVTETAILGSFSYPLTRNFRAKISTTFGRSRSNNQYEQVYRYNYSNANYQFGFTYDY